MCVGVCGYMRENRTIVLMAFSPCLVVFASKLSFQKVVFWSVERAVLGVEKDKW